MSELTQQEGYQVAGTRKTIIHKPVFSHTLLPPRHRLLITFQNSAINWGSIDQTLVLVADISNSTHISYEQENHFINCCWWRWWVLILKQGVTIAQACLEPTMLPRICWPGNHEILLLHLFKCWNSKYVAPCLAYDNLHSPCITFPDNYHDFYCHTLPPKTHVLISFLTLTASCVSSCHLDQLKPDTILSWLLGPPFPCIWLNMIPFLLICLLSV